MPNVMGTLGFLIRTLDIEIRCWHPAACLLPPRLMNWILGDVVSACTHILGHACKLAVGGIILLHAYDEGQVEIVPNPETAGSQGLLAMPAQLECAQHDGFGVQGLGMKAQHTQGKDPALMPAPCKLLALMQATATWHHLQEACKFQTGGARH